MTWISASFQIILFPTGGFRRWRFSSIQAFRFKADSGMTQPSEVDRSYFLACVSTISYHVSPAGSTRALPSRAVIRSGLEEGLEGMEEGEGNRGPLRRARTAAFA